MPVLILTNYGGFPVRDQYADPKDIHDAIFAGEVIEIDHPTAAHAVFNVAQLIAVLEQ